MWMENTILMLKRERGGRGKMKCQGIFGKREVVGECSFDFRLEVWRFGGLEIIMGLVLVM